MWFIARLPYHRNTWKQGKAIIGDFKYHDNKLKIMSDNRLKRKGKLMHMIVGKQMDPSHDPTRYPKHETYN